MFRNLENTTISYFYLGFLGVLSLGLHPDPHERVDDVGRGQVALGLGQGAAHVGRVLVEVRSKGSKVMKTGFEEGLIGEITSWFGEMVQGFS